jgi:hypothetical protein
MADAKDLRDYRRKAKEQRVSEEREAWLAGVLSWLPSPRKLRITLDHEAVPDGRELS